MKDLLKLVYAEQRFNLSEALCKRIEAELAKPEKEAVAWQNKLKPSEFYEYEQLDPIWYSEFRKLYAYPPRQQEPLSDDEIMYLWNNASFYEFARAIERSHGIGVEK